MLQQNDIVKPGDEIAVYSGGGYGDYSIATVAKVTPSGQIVLTDGRRFDKTGDKIGERTKWNSTTLHILTDGIRADIARKSNVRYLANVQWRKLDNAILAQVADLLRSLQQ